MKRAPKPGTKAADRRRRERTNRLVIAGATTALLLVAGGYLWLLGGTAPPRVAAVGGPWTLTRDDGRTVTDRDFRGRVLLMYFGYASCPDVCPLTLSAMIDALGRLGRRADTLQPLFITIDPARDTPATMRRYVRQFGSRLIGLTGTGAQLQAVEREYRVNIVVHRTVPGRGAGGRDDYTIDHSAVLYLIGPDGKFVAPIQADETSADMAADITSHLPWASHLP